VDDVPAISIAVQVFNKCGNFEKKKRRLDALEEKK
jgi:hypothetical protein